MAYKIIVSARAQNEIENTIDYYARHSYDAPKKFIEALQETYRFLSENPIYRIRYKNIRAIRLKRFPHNLYFVINETNRRFSF